MHRTADVWLHRGFQFSLHLTDIRFAQFIQETTHCRVVPELDVPGVLNGLIFHQRMRPQVQVRQVLIARQGG